jgi:hypothetical protein
MPRLSFYLTISLYLFLLAAGCTQDEGGGKIRFASSVSSIFHRPSSIGIDVYIDGDGKFPDFLVGKWMSDQGDWEIAFNPDGTIEYAVISLARAKIVPGKVTTIPMRLGGQGKFVPGQWSVRYLQKQRQLIAEIVIDSFRIELGNDIVFGKTRDLFSGAVSEKGTIWWTERYSYPEYFVETDKYHNYPLPADPNENPKEMVVFTKEKVN